MYGNIMKVITQAVLLPILSMMVEFFKKKLEQHFENQKLKKENKEKIEEYKKETPEKIKSKFDLLP